MLEPAFENRSAWRSWKPKSWRSSRAARRKPKGTRMPKRQRERSGARGRRRANGKTLGVGRWWGKKGAQRWMIIVHYCNFVKVMTKFLRVCMQRSFVESWMVLLWDGWMCIQIGLSDCCGVGSSLHINFHQVGDFWSQKIRYHQAPWQKNLSNQHKIRFQFPFIDTVPIRTHKSYRIIHIFLQPSVWLSSRLSQPHQKTTRFSHCPGDRRQHRPRGRQGPRRRERCQRGERRWGVGLGAACGTREATGGVKGSCCTCRCVAYGGSPKMWTWMLWWILCMDWFTVIRKDVGVWNVPDFHPLLGHPKMLWNQNGYRQNQRGHSYLRSLSRI